MHQGDRIEPRGSSCRWAIRCSSPQAARPARPWPPPSPGLCWNALWFGDGWAFVLQPIDASSTRLIVRYTSHPDVLFHPLLTYTIFESAHFVMESGMMLGIKRRAERDPLLSTTGAGQ